MKAYFLRHGETNYNLLGLCNDDPRCDVHLTARGKQQVEEAAQALKGERIEQIVISELPRTRESADIVNRFHGAPIAVHPLLNDWRTGLDSRPVAELYARIAPDHLHTRVNDGETLAEHRQRVLGFLAWLRQQPWTSALVVAHEETLRAVSAEARGLSDEAMLALKFRNAELLRFDF